MKTKLYNRRLFSLPLIALLSLGCSENSEEPQAPSNRLQQVIASNTVPENFDVESYWSNVERELALIEMHFPLTEFDGVQFSNRLLTPDMVHGLCAMAHDELRGRKLDDGTLELICVSTDKRHFSSRDHLPGNDIQYSQACAPMPTGNLLHLIGVVHDKNNKMTVNYYCQQLTWLLQKPLN